MRILHLAYEDPLQPGSGGGSIRNQEINRRLGRHHDIIALTAAYPGAKKREEGRVHWLPIGLRTGTFLDRLSYFFIAGLTARRFNHDLLVEDFGAPFSVAGSPLFTSRPVIAQVQWLFANEMRQKYHLPFHLIEQRGLDLYHHFISVSQWLAEKLSYLRPGAKIEAIPNGVEPVAFTVNLAKPRHLLFVGRLDIAQKGTDLLLQSVASARNHLTNAMPPLLIVGEGPDRSRLKAQIEELALGDMVRLCGRVTGLAKYELMAAAYAVLMPSRFETFGMVAAETMATGVPLIAFDVGPLAEVTNGIGSCLIPSFDVDAFARAITTCVKNPTWRSSDHAARQKWARRYDWDKIAALQEKYYLRVVAGDSEPVSWN